MTGPAPEVSVVIPTHSRWRFLRTALAGALAQEGVEIEVIVVDDGSSDETPAQLSNVNDNRLRVVRHDACRGVARARNAGISAARGRWIAFLDDDDIWSPKKLRKQLDVAASEPGDFAYGAAVLLDERMQPLQVLPAPDPHEIETRLLAASAIPAGSSNLIVTSELARDLQGFDSELAVLADWDFFIRLALVARGAASRDVVVGYFLHPENMHVAASEAQFGDELSRLLAKHRSVRLERGVDLDSIAYFQWVATRHRRAGRRLRAAQAYLRGARGGRSFGMLVRAVAVLLGEQVMKLGRRGSPRPGGPELAWLDRYR